MEIQRGRFTADIDGDFVVFLIGMRVNHPLRVSKWWPVASAMPKMLKVRKADTAAVRIGASTTDTPAVEPY